MSKFYAQLDNYGIVKAISDLGEEVIDQNLIEISAFDESLLNKKYDFELKQFVYAESDIDTNSEIIYNNCLPEIDPNKEFQISQQDRIETSIVKLENKLDFLLEQLNIKYE